MKFKLYAKCVISDQGSDGNYQMIGFDVHILLLLYMYIHI